MSAFWTWAFSNDHVHLKRQHVEVPQYIMLRSVNCVVFLVYSCVFHLLDACFNMLFAMFNCCCMFVLCCVVLCRLCKQGSHSDFWKKDMAAFLMCPSHCSALTMRSLDKKHPIHAPFRLSFLVRLSCIFDFVSLNKVWLKSFDYWFITFQLS